LRVGDFAAGLLAAVALDAREEGGLLEAALDDAPLAVVAFAELAFTRFALDDAGLATTGFAGPGRAELAATDRDDVAALLAPLAVAGRAVAALAADAAAGDLPAELATTLADTFETTFFSV